MTFIEVIDGEVCYNLKALAEWMQSEEAEKYCQLEDDI